MSIKDIYKVDSIKSQETYDWLLHKHYAKRVPSISYAFGLFKDKELVGICTYGMPPSSNLNNSITKIKCSTIELNRLCVNDNLDKNATSYFVSKTLNMIKDYDIVVSFSDLNMNHSGYIYQATNFLYTGETSNTKQLIDKNGNEFHFRNIGHYQEKLKGNKDIKHIKRRMNEENLDRIKVAKYLRENKGSYTANQLDKLFGYKDTAAHWFRLDKGFSYPSVDDWIKLKDILSLDIYLDKEMLNWDWFPCRNNIIKNLELKEIEIKPKHRYIYILKNKNNIINNLKYEIKPYPKGKNKRYDASYKPTTQATLF